MALFPTVTVPRNGAVLVRQTSGVAIPSFDVRFMKALAEGVQRAARSQGHAGDDPDEVEVSAIRGTYDWRAYLREEFLAAREERHGGHS